MERTFVMTWIYYNLTLFVFRFAFLFSKGRLAQHFTRFRLTARWMEALVTFSRISQSERIPPKADTMKAHCGQVLKREKAKEIK